ncbi:MAG: TonB-dependent receptor plug domain-containing protein, partial [Opitutaceae bacterium]
DSTLAGTRVRTDLKDVASSISVVTAQFMKDINATNNQTLLQYTPNTEVGGVYGNYAGVGNTFIAGISEGPNLQRPNNNTRVRGLDSADNTRDYFQTNIPWDSYIVGRVDLQRGPNSILFGIGSPAGIINASVNMASFKEAYKVENRYGSFGSLRNVLDFNHVLIPNELAIRVAALDDNTKYRQKPAYNHDKRVFAAVRWDPKWFNSDSSHTTFRANFERGEVRSNRPRILPPTDNISVWFTPAFNKMTWDPIYHEAAGIGATSIGVTANNGVLYGESKNPWVTQSMALSIQDNYNPVFYYNNLSNPSTPVAATQAKYYTWAGLQLNPDGSIGQGAIGGLWYGALAGIGGFNFYSTYNNKLHPTDPSTLGANANLWKDKPITDPTIFDFYNNLIDGPNKQEWQGWQAFNVALDQTFLNNRLAVNLVYDYQRYNDGSEANLSNPFISIDINTNTANTSPWGYYSPYVKKYDGTGQKGTNPYAGAAFVGSSSRYGNNANFSTRENIRGTVTGEVRATDFLDKSWLTELLGRHVITGLYSKETYNTETRSWARYAVGRQYEDVVNTGALSNNGLVNGDTVLDWVTYLSAPLFGKSSASGLNLQPITAVQSPSGTATIQWFNSHWNKPTSPTDPNYVNPAAAWQMPATFGPYAAASIQGANPANYVGWTNSEFPILNADQGDINQLYTDGSKIQTTTSSQVLTWQGFLWEDVIAATFGWRHDEQKQRSGEAKISSVLGAADMNYGLKPFDPLLGKSTGNTKSWGVVLHEPKALVKALKLPWGTNLSLTYNDSQNTRVQTRYGFSANLLPNAAGKTKDYGVVISTLNDRLALKVTWYKTTVTDANIASVTTGSSTLGANTNWAYRLEAYSVVSAMADLRGFAGQGDASNWYWNWAYCDAGFSIVDYGTPNWIGLSTSPAFLNAPITAKEKAAVQSAITQLPSQAWFDAYGYSINVAAAKAGDWTNAVPGYNYDGGAGNIQATGSGRVNGQYPTGTVNNESKGVEFELVGQLTKNWNVSLNASKQQASQTALGADLVNFIETQHAKFESPAGDLRLWYGGDMNLRTYYNQNVWAAYQFQSQSNGRLVAEMSPWRFNAVTGYSFDHGYLKGFNVGAAYRWQQGVILGYGLNAAGDNLDVNKPYWGKSQSAVDLWFGYGRKLTAKLDWHIQLNLRNVGEDVRLIPISVQPDGTYASRRIQEGQTWEVTNTFSF